MSPDMPMQGTPNRAPKAVLWIVLIVLVAGVIGLSYYVYLRDNGISNTNAGQNANANDSASSNANVNAAVDMSTWKTFTNSESGFSIRYPSTYIVTDATSDDGTRMVRFIDEAFSNSEVSVPYISIQEFPLNGRSLSQWTESYLEGLPSHIYDVAQVAGHAATRFSINSGSDGAAILHPMNASVILVYTFHSGRPDVQQIGGSMISSISLN